MKTIQFLQAGHYPNNLSGLMSILHSRMLPDMLHEIESSVEKSEKQEFSTATPATKSHRQHSAKIRPACSKQSIHALARNVTWDLYWDTSRPAQ